MRNNPHVYKVCPKCSKKVNKGLLVTPVGDDGYIILPREKLDENGNLTISRTWFDPNDFKMRKGFRQRYAKNPVREKYYGTMRVLDAVQDVK